MKQQITYWLAALLLCCRSVAALSQTTITLDSTLLSVDTIRTGLDIPWEMKWGADNTLWVTERVGIVSRIDPDNGNKKIILNISAANSGPVYQYLEAGLLGMALHPDFADSPYVYLVYDYQDNAVTKEKLVRYHYVNDSLVNPITFIDSVLGNRNHDGSRLLISPDRHLFMTTGDEGDSTLPQNLSKINGKLLRFNLDGSIPIDNPIPGSPIYSWGHRNSQGLLIAPNGIFYSSEHGADTDDELNIIEKGRNYGWPYVRGICDQPSEIAFCSDSNVVEPIASWTPTIAPNDLVWYNNADIPEWNNCLMMVVLKEKELIRFQLDSTGKRVTNQTTYLHDQLGRLRDIAVAPDGRVFLATNGPDAQNSQPGTHCIVRLQNKIHTGVNTITEDLFWSVYPNPASSTPMIKANFNTPTDCSVAVYDMQGKQLLHLDFGTVDHINANLPIGYAPGIYHVQLRVGEKVYWKKMVVE